MEHRVSMKEGSVQYVWKRRPEPDQGEPWITGEGVHILSYRQESHWRFLKDTERHRVFFSHFLGSWNFRAKRPVSPTQLISQMQYDLEKVVTELTSQMCLEFRPRDYETHAFSYMPQHVFMK